MRAVRIAFVCIALAALAAPARAEDKAAAKQAYAEGSKYYDLNQYAEALEAFKRAYWSYEDPSFLFNIAQCHRALGHKKEAVEFYRSYLRKSPNAPNRPDVEKIVADLQSAIDKERAAEVAPPTPTVAPSPVEAPAPAVVPPAASVHVAGPAPARKDRPVWKRGWFWGVVGGAVAVGVGVGVGVGLGTAARPPKADAQVGF